jgi:hypothetical protein
MSHRSKVLTALFGNRSLKQAAKLLKIPQELLEGWRDDTAGNPISPEQAIALAKHFKGDASLILRAQADDSLERAGGAVKEPLAIPPTAEDKKGVIAKAAGKVKKAVDKVVSAATPRPAATPATPRSNSPSNGKMGSRYTLND